MNAAVLLAAWEQGRGLPPWRQGLAVLAGACPDTAPAELAEWPVTRRDARLLHWREVAFGPRLDCAIECPACEQLLEFHCATSDVQVQELEPFTVVKDGWVSRWRQPTSADIDAVSGAAAGVAEAAARLRACCLVSVRRGEGSAGQVDDLPSSHADEALARMAEADARFALVCPECGHQWQSCFDVVTYVAREVEAWAWRTLREVDALARAYGWSEAEILGLSAARRRLYLEVVAS